MPFSLRFAFVNTYTHVMLSRIESNRVESQNKIKAAKLRLFCWGEFGLISLHTYLH